MAKNLNYYVERNNDTKEIVYIEYNLLDGYKVTPKTKKEDAIEVSKIVFVNPTLTEKIVKKKIDIKLKLLLSKLKEFCEDDSDNESGIRETLMTAERLKLTILNNYIKYLGEEYRNLTLKKLQIIINELRVRLFAIKENKYEQLYYQEEYEQEQNRGRRGR